MEATEFMEDSQRGETNVFVAERGVPKRAQGITPVGNVQQLFRQLFT